MPDRHRIVLAAAVMTCLGVLVGGWSSAAAAVDDDSAPANGGGSIPVEGRVRFEVGESGVLGVSGLGRFRDTVELLPSGPTMVNELAMEDYVAGVAEMPSRWAGEALKAQAVAARTYAWYSIGLGTFDDYDICATTACQVFRGAEVVLEGGQRWQSAVEATAGEVLVDEAGEPILARYFSTSGGRTYANDEVFPSTGAHDYLVAIEDPDDAVSPYHRWNVAFTRQEFDEILSRGETLAVTTPVASVERLGPVSDQGASFRVTGTDGTQVEVAAEALRDFLSRVAPSAYPDRFPTARSDGLRPLPTTVPSTRFEVEVTDDEVVLSGQGWGHGVGMGQYGARGRAERGQDYVEILAAYYGGLTPSTPADLPDRIRVGFAAGDEHAIGGDRPMTITDGEGTVLVDQAIGSWQVLRDEQGWRLEPPAGSDAELEVAATRSVDELLGVEDALSVETDVNKPVHLRLEVRDTEGDVVFERDLGTAEAGTHAATWRFLDSEGEPVPAGEYEVALLATDGAGETAGAGLDVSVDANDGSGSGGASGLPDDDSDPWGGLALVLGAIVVLPIALTVVVAASRKART